MYDNPKISVIVPVYNVEEFLPRCVESVLCQTYDNYEMILVDDGSTDSSSDICDLYAQKNDKIKVYHKPNSGLADARNFGLEHSVGDYVLFLDSDDFYTDENMFFSLLDNIGDADVLCFNYVRHSGKNKVSVLPKTEAGRVENILNQNISPSVFTSSACMKLVKRKILHENQIGFDKGIYGEDIAWSAKLLACTENIFYTGKVYYAYRVRPGSITKSVSLKHIYDLDNIVGKIYAMDVPGDRKDFFMGYAAFQYATIMINMHLCKEKIPNRLYKSIKEKSWLLKYDAYPQVKLINKVFRFAGFDITGRLLYIYFKLFRD